MFGFRSHIKKNNLVVLTSPDGKRVYKIQRMELYEPLAHYLNDDQIPAFVDKFFGYIFELTQTDEKRANSLTSVLLDKLYGEEYDFIGDLNSFTDKDGNVDWEGFLKEEN